MKILKIKSANPIKESIKHGDNYKIWLEPNMPNEQTGKGRKFAIKKIKVGETK